MQVPAASAYHNRQARMQIESTCFAHAKRETDFQALSCPGVATNVYSFVVSKACTNNASSQPLNRGPRIN